ncbi:nucleotide sugar dehydrogenase [Pseudoalteromonas undina]|uniref:Nucleotide sugar dehydrogenase n=1 Tax=Pseudoalteromonas undina TaxID=43660 RepID=A0ACC6R957_9GAMM
MKLVISQIKIAVIGLGYVGLPLACEFGKKFDVVGFDVDKNRVEELKLYNDVTDEVTERELKEASRLECTDKIENIANANVYIVTVPTPVDVNNKPDLSPLIKASEMLGHVIKKGDVIIYESTVYPGATEEDCIPVVERVSGLKFNEDFYAGYSPERINPGDKTRRVKDILKITSGSNPIIAGFVDDLYRSVIVAGTHKAPTIKVAEAAKVIENVQRDVNIALVNEFYQIFTKLGINTLDVIEAAATKWNFMKLKPGLVGGHCIGVDPYYLLDKAERSGYIPDLIRTAREINNGMVSTLVNDFIRYCLLNKVNISNSRVVILGYTFKADCPDIRNTKVEDIYQELRSVGLDVAIYDPFVCKDLSGKFISKSDLVEFDLAFLAVEHTDIIESLDKIKSQLSKSLIYNFQNNSSL